MRKAAIFAFVVEAIQGFYLPGVAPKDYKAGDSVPLLVNSLVATDSLLPFDYYHPGFGFCKPDGGPVSQRESLGSILFGDRLFTSPFKLSALTNETCVSLCANTVSAESVQFLRERFVADADSQD
ncbi:hypothetical protein HDU91_006937 [Kappamyces sp. JEL0680]|nr:hypothetical protein HDU91_006937 [Kappamyces sp. JEL0680]